MKNLFKRLRKTKENVKENSVFDEIYEQGLNDDYEGIIPQQRTNFVEDTEDCLAGVSLTILGTCILSIVLVAIFI